LPGLTYTISSAADREFQDNEQFRSFRRDLFHASLTAILGSLHAGMTTPEVTMCPDGHFRRVVYGIGPYIADYPEQVQLTLIVQGWCPRYVFFWPFLFRQLTIFEFRCHGYNRDLDAEPAILRSHEYTQQLFDTFDDATLWKTYGIASRTLVRPIDTCRACMVVTIAMIAIYSELPPRQHSPAYFT